jgi:putative hydrolase of the HAD superfamily
MARALDAVFFDVDDTLFSTTEFAATAQRAAVGAMITAGLRTTFDAAWVELGEIIAEFSSNDSHHYEKLLQRLPPEATAAVNPALVVAAGVVAYHETKVRQLRPFPEVHEVLAVLADTGLTLGAITSGLAVKQAEKLVRLGVLPFLRSDAVFITEQVGMAKSNPRLFERACRGIGVAPARAMYVGDRPVDDVEGPRRAGLVTVLRAGTGRHARQEPRSAPDHRIDDLRGLLPLLAERFGVPIPSAARASAGPVPK